MNGHFKITEEDVDHGVVVDVLTVASELFSLILVWRAIGGVREVCVVRNVSSTSGSAGSQPSGRHSSFADMVCAATPAFGKFLWGGGSSLKIDFLILISKHNFRGPFSAVSMPIFATKELLESSRRDPSNLHPFCKSAIMKYHSFSVCRILNSNVHRKCLQILRNAS